MSARTNGNDRLRKKFDTVVKASGLHAVKIQPLWSYVIFRYRSILMAYLKR